MDGSGELPTAVAKTADDYDGLPDSRVVARHAMFPATDHDDVARINFRPSVWRRRGSARASHAVFT